MLKVIEEKLTVKALVEFLFNCDMTDEIVIKQAGKELSDLMLVVRKAKEPEKFELMFK